MTRKQKIEILTAIHKGNAKLEELPGLEIYVIIDDPSHPDQPFYDWIRCIRYTRDEMKAINQRTRYFIEL